MSLEGRLQRLWYGPRWRSLPLWPLAWIYRAVIALRRGLYRTGLFATARVNVPVVVVGNLTVGGTGKTPIAGWLAGELAGHGHRVGIVLRGYGGRVHREPREVGTGSDPREVGDEALLHALRASCIVVVGADRVAAARRATELGAGIIVCDDGLQHLRLARDVEIAVVDAARGFGNGLMLPAGPLREPARRLERADAVVFTYRGGRVAHGLQPRQPLVVTARFEAGTAVNLVSGERRPLESFRGQAVHAVAGIGQPEAFFASLREAGVEATAHPLGDHASLDPRALPFPDGSTVLMTGKDAVKCSPFAGRDWWFVELDVDFEPDAAGRLLQLILERTVQAGAGAHIG